MNPPSNYETLYGVGLLDDLHNYFPSLLYDSSSFANVQDVLTYIQRQARNRFDLFSYGQREYLNTHPPPVPVQNRFVRAFSSMPPMPVAQGSTLPSASTTTFTVNIPVGDLDGESEEEEDSRPGLSATEVALANALLQLLPSRTLTRTYVSPNLNDSILGGRGNMNQFLQPVVVRPTAEQIAQNTTVGRLVSDTDQACAICQDTLSSEQDGRKLNACGHWFHVSCIDTWFERNVHCPVCRHDIREPMS